MEVLVVILLIVVVCFWGLRKIENSCIKDGELRCKEQNRFLEENKLSITQEYSYDYYNFRVVADVNSQKIAAFFREGKEIIPFSDLLGCEILVNNQVTGGVGRAVAGGIIAGGAGAVVGASTAKKSITSYKIVLYKREITNPRTEMELILWSKKEDDSELKKMARFAGDVNALVKAILARNNME